MLCSQCGKENPEAAHFCEGCGKALNRQDENTFPAQTINVPSLHELACPNCASREYRILGVKGSMAKSIGTAAFGAIGNLVASANAQNDMTTSPVKYKCLQCKKSFTTYPLQARPEELLSTPCTVQFERLGSFYGMAVTQLVYLNGVKMAPVKNKQTISFSTYLRYNALFVTDHNGVAFKGAHRFEAAPGGTVSVRFKRKFL